MSAATITEHAGAGPDAPHPQRVEAEHGTGLAFELPPDLEAGAPPARRDDVRVLVARRSTGALRVLPVRRLAEALAPGDLLVLNTSATVPAALDGRDAAGRPVSVHLSTEQPDGSWLVELRRPDGHGSRRGAQRRAGEVITLPGRRTLTLLAQFEAASDRLWHARFAPGDGLPAYLARHGEPIRYAHTAGEWPLEAYQTVFADEPGSATMPSAGRALTWDLLGRMAVRGVRVATVVLHAGIASTEGGERPGPEWFRVGATAASAVNDARCSGNRVIAVGTTVVRALETAADHDGWVSSSEGFTEHVVTPSSGARAVDGLLTGWHEPRASHLDMLVAIAGRDLLAASYDAALAARMRWHEFGDLHLILP